MTGAVAITIVLVIVLPVLVLISGAVVAAVLGYFLKKDRDDVYEDSELVELYY